MLPNFIIIGAQRCATGWMAQCLREHPEIFMAPDETRFFDRNFDKGIDWWDETYFKKTHEKLVIGEKTANYLTDKNAGKRIFDTLPNVKIICCLRDPIDRLYSAYCLKALTKPELKLLTTIELVQAEPDLIERGLYYEHLKNYYMLFPRKNILTVFYEDKINNPHLFIKKIYEFLNVSTRFTPNSLNVQTKPGALEYSSIIFPTFYRRLLHPRSPLRRLYSTIRRPSHTKLWTQSDINYLNNFFEHDSTELKRLLGPEFSNWQ